MTYDEKLSVIEENLRTAIGYSRKSEAVRRGALFELAQAVIEIAGDSDDILPAAGKVLSGADRAELAEFSLCVSKYYENTPSLFPAPETAELPGTVMIPEIARLEQALGEFSRRGISLTVEYGDSFAACAEDVEFGRSGYVLLPLMDPEEGRLGSFDRLRERYGLKIHAVCSILQDDGSTFSYQLCGLGFPGRSVIAQNRLSIRSEVTGDGLAYLSAVSVFGAEIISSDLRRAGDKCALSALFDVGGLHKKNLWGLLMYLSAGADVEIDGYYAEI